jgi:hypothetical protein
MVKAFSEIRVIHSEDVSQQHFKEIQVWRNKYLSITELSVTKEGALKEVDKGKELQNLATELIWLCVEIIVHNARNSKKQDF